MRKTLIFLSFIFILSLPQPAYAASLGSGGPLDFLLNFFHGVTGYVAKDPSVDLNLTTEQQKSNFTTYSKDITNPNDITTRSLSDNSRLLNKGQQIEDIITNFYSDSSSLNINEEDDKVLAAFCNNTCLNADQYTNSSECRYIRTSEIAYFYLTQNDSTSYEIIDGLVTKKAYSADIQNRLNLKYQGKITLADAQCYSNLYNRITVTPKSNDSNKAQENTGISQQLNNTEKTLVPKTHGDQEAPPLGFWDSITNFFGGGKTEKLKDNLYKEKVFLSDFTSEKDLETISQDDNNQNLRNNFNRTMQPASWQQNQIPNDQIIDSAEDSTISYGDQYPTNGTSTVINNVSMYIFEPTSGGRRISTRYDIGIVDSSKLADIPDQYKAGGASNTKLDSRVIPSYIAMVDAARASGIPSQELNLISGYRSVAQQQVLWDQSDKSGVKVARPGSSPHHTGRAIDIVVAKSGTSGSAIEREKNSSTYKWLQANAATFGFYNYPVEPWHWEYNPKAP